MAKARSIFWNGGSSTLTVPAGVTRLLATNNPLAYPKFSFGNGAVFFIDQTKAMFSFGTNTSGQLGENSVAPGVVSSPVAVSGGLSWLMVQSDAQGTYAQGLDINYNMYCWGQNASGQLGNNAIGMFSSPVQVVGGIKWAEFASRNSSSNNPSTQGGIDEQGNAYFWGLNTSGVCGNSSATTAFSSPVAVTGGVKFTWVHFGSVDGTPHSSAFGCSSIGFAYAWGYNGTGNLGDGTTTNRSSPVTIAGFKNFARVYAAFGGAPVSAYTVGIDVNNAMWSWGSNNNGCLGQNVAPSITAAISSPVQVVGGIKFKGTPEAVTFLEGPVGTNVNTWLAIDTGGNLWGCGANNKGWLGDGTTTDRSSPVQVVGGLKFTKVQAFRDSVLALTTSGDLYGFGLNTKGQLGQGNNTACSSPIAVAGGLKFADFMCDTVGGTAYGMSSGGQIWSWGNNSVGQMGNNSGTTPASSPIQVVGGKVWQVLNNQPVAFSFDTVPGNVYPAPALHILNAMWAGFNFGPSQSITVEFDQ